MGIMQANLRHTYILSIYILPYLVKVLPYLVIVMFLYLHTIYAAMNNERISQRNTGHSDLDVFCVM